MLKRYMNTQIYVCLLFLMSGGLVIFNRRNSCRLSTNTWCLRVVVDCSRIQRVEALHAAIIGDYCTPAVHYSALLYRQTDEQLLLWAQSVQNTTCGASSVRVVALRMD